MLLHPEGHKVHSAAATWGLKVNRNWNLVLLGPSILSLFIEAISMDVSD